MKKERKIIVYIATSADGYIARKDGNVDWLNYKRTAGDYGMGAFYSTIDTILWGRKTCGVALDFEKEGTIKSAFDPKVKNYVFSRKVRRNPPPGVEFVHEPIATFAKRLRSEPGKDIWMMGGAGLIASFLDAGEIDEFIIHVVPIFVGEGIPLVQPKPRNVPLLLKSLKSFKDGVLQLHYEVPRSKAGKSRR
jgi:dihydrofolate reductase